MKIYTKKGDKGETFLADGSKVKKYDKRVDLYGMCDHLNSHLGLVIALIRKEQNPKLISLEKEFTEIQNFLFEVGAELAGYYKNKNESIIKDEDVFQLENWIDTMNKDLPEIRSFILPGGSEIASHIHICRTISRSLERKLVEVFYEDKSIKLFEIHIQYFNRLSDYFFIAARFTNFCLEIQEILWESKRKKDK